MEYLTSAGKYGKNYAPSTVYNYGLAIDVVSNDITTYLEKSFTSLFNIIDVDILNEYFNQFHTIPQIIEEEKVSGTKKSSAFRRYIEFCQTIAKPNFNVNQPELDDIYEVRSQDGEKIIISKAAERDALLRSLAIKIHGTNCFGCNFNFVEKYGKAGEGFIEIHHTVPLARYEESRVIDPKTDLIPLCSNCHRIVHRRKDFVLTLEELKVIINQN
ncbi:HNH endonuclease [Chryseobacterium sp. MYb264]|uniref:HNH endonuclease n=1 Tax=Chryseobacterium sp. MYb264 TaxID=2745153 RepID=UPI002E1261ED|nr:HNH endonuclease [Chryseobacterium sp. MYb264]